MTIVNAQILTGLGIGYSIAGLAIVMPFCFLFRSYLRFLDHLQFFLLFATTINLSAATSSMTIFSTYLGYSWVQFPANIFEFFCVGGDFICTAGFALSFGACLLVFLLLMRIIVSIEKCRNGQIRFEPVYTFFKGFTRWVYLPLSYYSLYYLILSIQGNADNIISSVIILAICVIFPILQLIGYKCIQKAEDYIWRKWLEFFSFLRLMLLAFMGAIANALNDLSPNYVIYGILALFVIIYAWKHKFTFKIGGRIVFVLGECILIAVFSFFLFYPALLSDYQIDLFAVSAVFLIDLVYHLRQFYQFRTEGVPKSEAGSQINPEQSKENIFPDKKKFMQQSDDDLQDSNNYKNVRSSSKLASKSPQKRYK